MKKFLRFLALIMANVIPTGMAAVDYGITVGTNYVTSSNANNITGSDILSGKVTYNASTNTLTLNNVTLSTTASGIVVSSSAPDKFHIVLEGTNVFKHQNGQAAAVVIYKSKSASTAMMNCYIEGKGSLYLENNDIICKDGVWLNIGNGVMGGEGYGGPAIYARSIYGRSDTDPCWFSITDGGLHLSGSPYGTFYNFGALGGIVGYNSPKVYTPEGATFNYAGMCLTDSYGEKVTGEVYIGWERYGLRVSGVDVNAKNKDIIGDLTTAITGTVKYDPNERTLFLTNAICNHRDISGKQAEATIVNTEGSLTIEATGDCHISNSFSRQGAFTGAAVASSQNVTFKGNGTLELYSSCAYAVKMEEATDRTVLFVRSHDNTKFVVSGYGCGIDCNGGRLYLGRATLNMKYGGIKNVGELDNRYCEISSDNVYYDKQWKGFYKIGSDGTPSPYAGPVNFVEVSDYYGINVCGVQVTDHNCSHIAAPYIKGGSISYDPQAHQLTLENLNIDTKQRAGFSPIQFINAANTGMKILLKGNNVIKPTNGAAILFWRPGTATSNTDPHYYITGTGSLTIEDEGILVEDYCNLCFGSGKTNGEGQGGCTINAAYLRSYFTAQGRIKFTDCMMNLTGGANFGTLSNFAEVSTTSSCMIRTPENGKYDTTNHYLADADGNMVDGEVYVGWKKYGLKICGVEVTEVNKDNIKDVVNSRPTIYKKGTSSDPDKNTFFYNPSNKTLYMENVSIMDYCADTNAPCIENTGDKLRIWCEGNCEIVNQRSGDAIYSTKDFEFYGPGTLDIMCQDQSNGIMMDGDNLELRFTSCNVSIRRNPSTGSTLQAINHNSTAGLYRLLVDNSNVRILGSAHGISLYELRNAAISTPQVFVQPANDTYLGCFRAAGAGEYCGETVFKPTTTNYGIRIAGWELNDVNRNNFYYDNITAGTVSYNPDSNTLTLSDVAANCLQKRYFGGKIIDLHPNGIIITEDAPSNVKIELTGNNVISNIDGVGIAIFQNTTFRGNGTLDLADKTIASYKGSNIVFDQNCTVNASQLYGSNDEGGKVSVLDNAKLNLTGNNNGYPTVWGLDGFFTQAVGTNVVFTAITTPNGAWYDTSQKKLVSHVIDGHRVVYGPVQVAPVTYYGIEVEAIQVHSANCDDIFRDVPHEGKMHYNYLEHRLYMEDFKVEGSRQVYGIYEHSQDRKFYISLSGENEVTNFNYFRFADDAIFESSDNGSLSAPLSLILPDKSLLFDGCTVDGPSRIESKSEEGDVACLVNGSNIHLWGNDEGKPTISGFSKDDNTLLILNSRMTTPENYTDDYSGEVIIQAIEYYDITVNGTKVSNMNKNDILGNGTMSMEINEETGEYILTMTDAHLVRQIYIDDNCAAEAVVIILNGQSSITTDREDCIYAGRPVIFRSHDGQGKLTLETWSAAGIFTVGDYITVQDCEVDICAGTYGIEGIMKAGPVPGEIADYVTYVNVTANNYTSSLKIDTKTYDGEENLKDVGLHLASNNEIVQPADCAYNTDSHQLRDTADDPLHNTVVEIIMKPTKISVEDITRLIDDYLEPDSDITVEDITNLIDRYLEQE
ncbi:MAG: hypothetical protein IJ901_04255 [Bacteroidaceae bacterium]|nr:hypothetical protein [Bacteroidaceae bacterium]